jgi:bifunctional DNA-binding transcriptional regulator/antitoxin component of YhaV-PrlF toxin-antitoxin module
MPPISKIAQKGQLTIPQKTRKKLNSEMVEFAIIEDQGVLKQVKSIAGSLKSYVRRESLPFKKAQERAWTEAVEENHFNTRGLPTRIEKI